MYGKMDANKIIKLINLNSGTSFNIYLQIIFNPVLDYD